MGIRVFDKSFFGDFGQFLATFIEPADLGDRETENWQRYFDWLGTYPLTREPPDCSGAAHLSDTVVSVT